MIWSISTPGLVSAYSEPKPIESASPIKVHLPSYFQPWINISYYLLLIPFKIKENETFYYIYHNKFQRVRNFRETHIPNFKKTIISY